MTTPTPFAGVPESTGTASGFEGLRVIWSAGGLWERFFLLCPLWWGIFVITLLVVSSAQSTDAFLRIFVVAFSFVALVDAWWTPIASATVLEASIGTGMNKSDENARLVAGYLRSLAQGGHWLQANLVSFAYLAAMFGWGFVAVEFERISGSQNSWSFFPLYFASLIGLWSAYRLMLKQFLRAAKQAGYPILFPVRT